METKDRKPRRWIWAVLALVLLLWSVPAAFVSLYRPSASEPSAADPSITQPSSALLSSAVNAAVEEAFSGGRSNRNPFFGSGYTRSWAVETWKGAGEDEDEATADKHRVQYRVERGPLDREAGTYGLAVGATLNHAEDVQGMRLYVTGSASWSGAQEDIWTLVEEVRVPEPGAATVSMVCLGTVPASSTAYRVEELRGGVVLGGFSRNTPTAPTALGRAYDAIAWRSAFRWLPKLR